MPAILGGIPTFVIIIIVFAAIALISFIIYKIIHPKKKDHKPSEEEIAKEELNRILVQVDDEKTAEEIKSYKPENDEESETTEKK